MLDPAARRLLVAAAVRLHVARVLGTRPLVAAGLDVAAASLRPTDDHLAAAYGLAFDPPFPGTALAAGGSRLVLVCRATHAGMPAAVVVTTLVVGRAAQVTAAPPETAVPGEVPA